MIKSVAREAAKALGLPSYFTGKPCKRGHVAERWVSGYSCVVCHAAHAKRPEARTQRAEYARTPKARAQQAVYNQTPERRAKQAEYCARQRQKPQYRVQKMGWMRQLRTGMPPDIYQYLLIAQAGLCAICDKQMVGMKEPHADHSHDNPGIFRGLLCTGCNSRRVPLVENPELLRRVQAYLADYNFVAQTFPLSIPLCF